MQFVHIINLGFTLALRQVKAKYRQSFLGVLWIGIQPLSYVLLFTFIFQYIAQLKSLIVPYPVMIVTGIFCYSLFSSSLLLVSQSFISNKALILHTNCSKLTFPITAILVSIIDNLLVIFFYMVPISSNIVYLPVIIILNIFFAFSLGLFFGCLIVWLRDFRFIIQYSLQLLIWITPIGYKHQNVNENIQFIINLNPLTHLVILYRWSIYGDSLISFDFKFLIITIIITFVLSIISYMSLNKRFTDVI